MKRSLTAVAGYFGRGNFGDDWLYQAWLNQLNGAENTVEWPRVWPGWLLNRTIKRAVFLGGLFQDLTSRRSLAWYLLAAALARRRAEEGVSFEAASIGPIGRPMSREWMKRFLSVSASQMRFVVRDEASLELLRRWAPSVEARLEPDPTWSAPWPLPSIDPDETIGLLLNGSLRHGDLLQALSAVAIHPKLAGRLVLILSHPASDQWQAKWLMRHAGRVWPTIVYRPGGIEEFLSRMNRCRALISLRLHGAIAGLRAGRPVAGFEPPGLPGALEKIRTMALPPGRRLEWFGAQRRLLDWLEAGTGILTPKVLS
ncbi:MAG: polysaccharide pyruvyl transferase family protein [Elusimicrobia bacterium]|nr:polysaccharide pyruvyl transferase family protein [Elusimicrobiota bacterium]